MCDHTKIVYRKKWMGYDDDERDIYEMVPEEESTFIDISVHWYQCTQCKQKFPYSSRSAELDPKHSTQEQS